MQCGQRSHITHIGEQFSPLNLLLSSQISDENLRFALVPLADVLEQDKFLFRSHVRCCSL